MWLEVGVLASIHARVKRRQKGRQARLVCTVEFWRGTDSSGAEGQFLTQQKRCEFSCRTCVISFGWPSSPATDRVPVQNSDSVRCTSRLCEYPPQLTA